MYPRIAKVLGDAGIITEPGRDRLLTLLTRSRKTLPPLRVGDIAVEDGILDKKNIRRARQALQKMHTPLMQHCEAVGQALSSVYEHRAILYLGAGFSIPADLSKAPKKGLKGSDLCRRLVKAAKPQLRWRTQEKQDDVVRMGLPRAAQFLKNQGCETLLVPTIERCCQECIPDTPLEQHLTLARINAFRFIVTTNWDQLVETAYRAVYLHSPNPLSVVRSDDELDQINLDGTTLIKLHGDFRNGRFRRRYPPRVTEADFVALREQNPILFSLLESLHTTHDVVVIGFRTDDYNFSQLYNRITCHLSGTPRNVYVVDPENDLAHGAASPKTQHIELGADEFITYLDRFVHTFGGQVGLASEPPCSRMGDSGDVVPFRFWCPDLHRDAKWLRRKLGLRHVEIVQPHRNDLELQDNKTAVGRRASHLLRRWAEPGDKITFGGGVTLKAMIEVVDPRWDNLRDVQLYAAVTPAFDSFSVLAPITLVSLLAERLHHLGVVARAFQLPPVMAESRIPKECWNHLRTKAGSAVSTPEVRHGEFVQRALEQYRRDVAQSRLFFLGVGSIELDYGGFAELCTRCASLAESQDPPDEKWGRIYRSHLQKEKYVGDLMYRPFIDLPNSPSGQYLDDMFLTETRIKEFLADSQAHTKCKLFMTRLYYHVFPMRFEALRAAAADPNKAVVLIASGKEKARAVRSLCNARLANAIVIDQELGTEIRGLLETDSIDRRR